MQSILPTAHEKVVITLRTRSSRMKIILISLETRIVCDTVNLRLGQSRGLFKILLWVKTS